MRVGEILFFSKNYRFDGISFDTAGCVAKAYKDRVETWYFQPIEYLLHEREAFAAGMLICCTLDLLAQFSNIRGKDRIAKWLEQNIGEFRAIDPDNSKRRISARFQEEFRHGLIHEGRVKNMGQFVLDEDHTFTSECECIKFIDGAMVVNPERFYHNVKKAFNNFNDEIDSDPAKAKNLQQKIKSAFSKEIQAVARQG